MLAVSNRTPQQTSSQSPSTIPDLTSAPSEITNSSDGQYIPLTPTIIPASQQGLQTFIYFDPSRKYTFDYPSTWKLSMTKRNPDWVRVILFDRNSSNNSCGIEFSKEPHDFGQSSNYTTSEQVYAGKKVKVWTFYENNSPITESLLFEDFNYNKNPFTNVDVSFSHVNTTQCQKIVDQILSTLKFYY